MLDKYKFIYTDIRRNEPAIITLVQIFFYLKIQRVASKYNKEREKSKTRYQIG